MKRYELITFPDSDSLARAAAAGWMEKVEECNQRQQPQFVALSGGRIAREFFSAAATVARARSLSLAQVHFFWADERCVPPDDPESNYGVADQFLFQPLRIDPAHVHRIRGETEPSIAAENAQAEMHRIVGRGGLSMPVLDLVFLGMGEDGHVASLFPGGMMDATNSPTVFRSVVAPKPPPDRITLTYTAIAAAREVWILASGKGKGDALKRSLTVPDGTPLSRIIRSRQFCRILADIPVNLDP